MTKSYNLLLAYDGFPCPRTAKRNVTSLKTGTCGENGEGRMKRRSTRVGVVVPRGSQEATSARSEQRRGQSCGRPAIYLASQWLAQQVGAAASLARGHGKARVRPPGAFPCFAESRRSRTTTNVVFGAGTGNAPRRRNAGDFIRARFEQAGRSNAVPLICGLCTFPVMYLTIYRPAL